MNRAGIIFCSPRAASIPGWWRVVMRGRSPARRVGVIALLYAFALSGFLAGTLLAAKQAQASGEPGIHCLLDAGHHADPYGAARHEAECLAGCPVPPVPPLPPAPDARILGFDARSMARIGMSGLRERADVPAAPPMRAHRPRGPPVFLV